MDDINLEISLITEDIFNINKSFIFTCLNKYKYLYKESLTFFEIKNIFKDSLLYLVSKNNYLIAVIVFNSINTIVFETKYICVVSIVTLADTLYLINIKNSLYYNNLITNNYLLDYKYKHYYDNFQLDLLKFNSIIKKYDTIQWM